MAVPEEEAPGSQSEGNLRKTPAEGWRKPVRRAGWRGESVDEGIEEAAWKRDLSGHLQQNLGSSRDRRERRWRMRPSPGQRETGSQQNWAEKWRLNQMAEGSEGVGLVVPL